LCAHNHHPLILERLLALSTLIMAQALLDFSSCFLQMINSLQFGGFALGLAYCDVR